MSDAFVETCWQNRADEIYLSGYQIQHLTYVLAIFQAVMKSMLDAASLAAWFRQPSSVLSSEQTPIEFMMSADNCALSEFCRRLMQTLH